MITSHDVDSTREALLRAAEQLVRTRGYSAFSYADLAEAVGIRKASIHHHFPAKSDLGCALVDNYSARFEQLCGVIETEHRSAPSRLLAYGALYAESLKRGHLCLCGMLASELAVLPSDVALRVRTFFAAQLKWLQRVIAAGQAAAELGKLRSAKDAAESTFAVLQGAMLLGWTTGDVKVVNRASAESFLALQR
jgi:TetR/AcrR family transcriptional regulator, transcriptional repressor for nem operon